METKKQPSKKNPKSSSGESKDSSSRQGSAVGERKIIVEGSSDDIPIVVYQPGKNSFNAIDFSEKIVNGMTKRFSHTVGQVFKNRALYVWEKIPAPVRPVVPAQEPDPEEEGNSDDEDVDHGDEEEEEGSQEGSVDELRNNRQRPPAVTKGFFDDLDVEESQDPYEGLDYEEARALFRKLLEMQQREKKKHKDDLLCAYALLIGNCHETSLDVLKQSPQFAKIEERRSALHLFQLILITHSVMTPNMHVNIEESRATLRNDYARMYQRSGESLVQFHSRFLSMIERYRILEEPEPTQQAQAQDFLRKLDKNRFGQLMVQISNNVSLNGIQPPSTLLKMYEIAGSFSVLTSHNTVSAAAVYSTTSQSQKNNNSKRDKGKKGESKGGAKQSGDNKTDGNKKKTFPRWHCNLCETDDHWFYDCAVMKTAKAKLSELKELAAGGASGGASGAATLPINFMDHSTFLTTVATDDLPFKPIETVLISSKDSETLILDNASSTHIVRTLIFFEGKKLYNLENNVRINGINSSDGGIVVTKYGLIPGIGRVLYHQNASANVLSQARLVDDNLRLVYDSENDNYSLTDHNGDEQLFQRKMNFYERKDSKNNSVLVTSVEKNKKMFNRKQILDAENAKKLQENLGFAPSGAIAKMILNGGITNVQIPVKALENAEKIFGKPRAIVLGQMKNVPNKPVIRNDVDYGLPRKVTLHMDLIFVFQQAYLLSVSVPFNITLLTTLSSKTAEVILKGIKGQVGTYNSHGILVIQIVFDGESGVAAIEHLLNIAGIRCIFKSSGDHVAIVERKAQTVKNRARTILASLPFQLPHSLMPYLLGFVVNRINMIPNTVPGLTPRVALTGKTLDAIRDVNFSFGAVVAFKDPHNVSNSMNLRARIGFAMQPTNADNGSILVFDPLANRVVSRYNWTLMTGTENDFEMMTKLAQKERQQVSYKDLKMFRNNNPVSDTMDETTEHDFTEIHSDTNDFSKSVAEKSVAEVQQQFSENLQQNHEPGVVTEIFRETDLGDTKNVEDSEENESELEKTDENDPELAEGAEVDLEPAPNIPLPVSKRRQPLAYDPAATREPLEHKYGTRSRQRQQEDEVESTLLTIHEIFATSHSTSADHMSPKKAMQMHGKQLVSNAVYAEVHQLVVGMKAFMPVSDDLVTLRPIPSHMFVKAKKNTNGQVTKYKARLVGGGHRQVISPGMDTSSPTAATQSIMLVALLAAMQDWHVYTVDITGAYLNAKMEDDVFVILDPLVTSFAAAIDPLYKKHTRPNGTCVVKLLRALYGCVQSAKLWYLNISQLLQKNGFTKNPYDECVFNRTVNGVQTTIVLYVDDMMLACSIFEPLDFVVELLEKEYGKVTVNKGKVHEYLGMKFDFTCSKKVVISMFGYINDILETNHVTKVAPTPAHDLLFHSSATSLQLENVEKEKFHRVVAQLLFLAKRGRPDILLPVAVLTKKVQQPTVEDNEKLNRILAYLNGTRELPLTLEAKKDLQAICYCDAAHANHPDRKGHKGILFTLGSGCLLAVSTKLKLTTKSSTESELVAASDAGSALLHIKRFLIAQNNNKDVPAKMYQDNMSTVKLLQRGAAASNRTRHIDIHHFWLRDQIEIGNLDVEWLKTTEMVSDILTKPLQGEAFRRLRNLMMNWSPQNEEICRET